MSCFVYEIAFFFCMSIFWLVKRFHFFSKKCYITMCFICENINLWIIINREIVFYIEDKGRKF